jgi:hypothetical protein
MRKCIVVIYLLLSLAVVVFLLWHNYRRKEPTSRVNSL